MTEVTSTSSPPAGDRVQYAQAATKPASHSDDSSARVCGSSRPTASTSGRSTSRRGSEVASDTPTRNATAAATAHAAAQREDRRISRLASGSRTPSLAGSMSTATASTPSVPMPARS